MTNEDKSQEVQFAAFGWDSTYGVLPPAVESYLQAVKKRINTAYAGGDDQTKSLAVLQSGVITRLSSVLLQIRRLLHHRDNLLHRLSDGLPTPLPGVRPGQDIWAAFAEREAAADFEALLFHSRALLDQLTLAIARHHGSSSHQFSKLSPLLSNFVSKDARAREMQAIIEDATSLAGVLVDLEKTSLRSLITHRGTVTSSTSVLFAAYLLPGGKQLILDCEAFGYPLLKTTRKLAQDVPYLALNGIAIYLGMADRLPRLDFVPEWGDPTVSVSEFETTDPQDPLWTVVQSTHPDGFKVRRVRLRGSILAKAVEVPPKRPHPLVAT